MNNHSEVFYSTAAEQNCVLVAVDFSADSRAAVAWACRYAEMSGKPLVLLHVVHDPASDPGFYVQASTGHMQPLQEVAESMMHEFIESLKAEDEAFPALDRATSHQVPGLPPSRIVEVANLLDASLLVIGSRGLTGVEHMLIGSVAERVVQLSTRPTVVVKSPGTVPGKKALKKAKKRRKKELKKLERLLGIDDKGPDNGDTDG